MSCVFGEKKIPVDFTKISAPDGLKYRLLTDSIGSGSNRPADEPICSNSPSRRTALENIHSDVVVYYESIKRELKTKPIYECRCDERLKTRVEESTRLACTQLVRELKHPKTETRLIDEMFASEMGECAFLM